MDKKTAFYIGHGVEVRHFVLSGIYQAAIQKNGAVIIMEKDVESKFLKEYLDTSEIIYLNDFPIKKRHWIEGYITAIRKARLRLRKIGNFHNLLDTASNKWKDLFLGNQLIFFISTYLSNFFLKKHYSDMAMISFLKKENYSVIFLLDYNEPLQLQLGYSANKANIPVKIIINTLKSFYINDYLPFKVDKLYTWSNSQRQLFTNSNFHLPAKSFYALGSAYHNFILSPQVTEGISEELKLLESKPFIIYSLLFERVYESEFQIVSLINQFINENFKTDAPKIVIRRNPFEEKEFNIDAFSTLNNVFVAPHSWERKANKGWSIQAYKGELEWKYLLEKARLLVNVTSMAGIEAIISGTPVIHVGFNGNGDFEPRLKRFSNAPFLEDILISDYVKLSLDIQEFGKHFLELYPLKEVVDKETIKKSINISYFNEAKIKEILN